MEMMIPQIVSNHTPMQSAVPSSAAGKNSGNTGFQQTLVQQINNSSAGGAENTQPVQLAGTAVVPEAVAAEGGPAAPSLSDLLAIIDGLIDKLDERVTANQESGVLEEQEIRQLEAALDQMNALLALVGVQVMPNQPPLSLATIEAEGQPAEATVLQAAALKSSLQDTLLQLQAMLQQGSVKLVQQQEPAVFVNQQLQALTAILEGGPADTMKSQTKSAAHTQQLFTAQGVRQAETSTLLQRLSQQAVHPAYLTAIVQSNEASVQAEQTGTVVEAVPQVQPGTTHAETLRGFTPPVQAAAAAATSFVVADQFAESMTGMIIQKFDVSTLNGVSEAKLMLFPEHLGQVDVRITMQNGLLTAVFQTDTAMAKDMLDNQMAQLRSALQAQGLMVDKLEVSQGQTAAQLSHQQHGQGSSQQQSASRQSFNGEDAVNETVFETEMIEQAAVQGLGYGRGINVKA
ncbi:flagellar hook-length control protein FliK [Paenibacillus harenae]|uniref:flagellar hook-length control protein FliK n=1 Tax=Paenibacillus harenae TaxID=306543 RepID=UPI0004174F4A|nr:flagellar hook-length control protein FliK [Paenibacillus harenae]